MNTAPRQRMIAMTYANLRDGDVFSFDNSRYGKPYTKRGDMAQVGDEPEFTVRVLPSAVVYICEEYNATKTA